MEKKYPTWEILGVVIGFIGSANLIPDLFNLFFEFYPEPSKMSRWFKIYCISGYLVLIVVLSFRYLITLGSSQTENSDGVQVVTIGRGGGYLSALSDNNVVSFVRDFPISLFRSLVSKFYKIVVFDIFNRRPEWEARPELFRQIVRAYLGERTVELQFRKDFEKVEARETTGGHNFGQSRQLSWMELEFPFLTFTTWLGCLWTLCHFIVTSKLFSKFRIVVSGLYFIGFLLHVADVFNLSLSYSSMNLTWQIWIIYLLIFDFLTALGLYRGKIWGEVSLLLVSFSQVIAYTMFIDVFQNQSFLVKFHTVILSVYFLLRFIEFVRAK